MFSLFKTSIPAAVVAFFFVSFVLADGNGQSPPSPQTKKSPTKTVTLPVNSFVRHPVTGSTSTTTSPLKTTTLHLPKGPNPGNTPVAAPVGTDPTQKKHPVLDLLREIIKARLQGNNHCGNGSNG